MTGEDRAALRARFLVEAGWRGAQARPLAGDASNRRYERLRGGPGGAGAVLMDSPPEKGEDPAPFLAATARLRDAGFSAPEVLAADARHGFVLLEDLGDALFAKVCAEDGALERPLYAAAGALLAELQSQPPALGAFSPEPYGAADLLREAMLAADWWWRGAEAAPPSDLVEDYRARVTKACAAVAEARDALVLRDYHAENLIWLPDRRGSARVGLLDYQDALAGHGAYDLVSLTEDARRDVSPEARRAAEDAYFAGSGADRDAFAAAAAVLATQRNLKIVGIFARLRMRDGKPAYVDLIPRVWAHLERDLQHPALADLRSFVHAHMPSPTPERLARLKAGA
ncbi:MAG: phosphotransferase [Pseudomonadota bacterium]